MVRKIIDTDLSELAVQANKFHADVESAGQSAVQAAWHAGHALLSARGQIKTGTWKSWLENHFRGSQPTASGYIRLAIHYKRASDLHVYTSIREALAAIRKPRAKSKNKPAPQQHSRHDEVVELDRQGMSQQDIAETTGIGKRQVRHIVEREHTEQAVRDEVKDQAVVIDWDSLPGPVAQKIDRARRQIRRELEAEFEPRVQAGVQERLSFSTKRMEQLAKESRLVLDARKGILSRANYDLIRSSLHPDSRLSITDEKLAEAFRMFNELEILFLNEKDRPTTRLPSMEDLLKRRKPAS